MPKLKAFSIEQEKTYFFDLKLFFITIALNIVGLISIFSATFDSNMSTVFYRQLFAIGVGLALMISITFVPSRIIKPISWGVYGLSILLLVIVLIFGTEVYGTKGWLRFGSFSFQPAEFAKIGVLMGLATHISRKGVDIRNIRDFGITALITLVPIVLIMLQPDHGTASVLFILLLGILFWAGFNSLILYVILAIPIIILLSLKSFALFVVAVILASLGAVAFRKKTLVMAIVISLFIGIGYLSPFVYSNLMEHQKARIETFLNPGSDPRGSGYNVMQSILAVGSGGITGKGYLQGTQTQLRYIPMQWTDFIYSVPTEEFGFLGGVSVILLFVAFIYRTINIAILLDDKFYSIITIGTALIFLYHCLINIGMSIGFMPVMGIPLPFMSYGGTSAMINMMLVGLVLNAYRNTKLKRFA